MYEVPTDLPPEQDWKLVAPPEDVARAKRLLEGREWTFAKTMPHNPHHYSLRKKWENDDDFVWVVRFIRQYGIKERYPPKPARGATYVVLYLDDYKYWTFGARIEPGPWDRRIDTSLINRKPANVV